VRVFTVATISHIHLSEVMIKSFCRSHSGFDVSIIIPDLSLNNRSKVQSLIGRNIELLSPNDLGPIDVNRLRHFYNALEFCSAMKVVGFQFFLLRGEDVLFLDPDVLILGSLHESLIDIEGDVLLSPHIFKPYPNDSCSPNDLDIIRSGHINGGVILVRNSIYGKQVINWLISKVDSQWFVAPKVGLYADQLWLSMLPYLFENTVSLIMDPGINVAYWNLHERQIGATTKGQLVLKSGEAVKLIHFSGFDGGGERLSKHSTRTLSQTTQEALASVIEKYRKDLEVAQKRYSEIHSKMRFARGPLFLRMKLAKIIGRKNTYSNSKGHSEW
jgi:hypothetical protein